MIDCELFVTKYVHRLLLLKRHSSGIVGQYMPRITSPDINQVDVAKAHVVMVK
jgi:hypothetical protein